MQCTGNLGCFSQEKRAAIVQRYSVVFSCVQCFHVSVNHQPLTWTTGSLTCVCDHSYARVRIHRGVGHTDNESAQHFDSEKLSQIFLVLRMGFEPLVFRSRVDALPQVLSTREECVLTNCDAVGDF